MKRSLNTLTLALWLATASYSVAFAQDFEDMSVPAQENSVEAPATEAEVPAVQEVAPVANEGVQLQEAPEYQGVPAGATGASVKFTSDGANRPVLETLSPDAEGIEFDPDLVERLSQVDAELAIYDDMPVKKGGLPQFEVSTYPKQIFWLTLLFVFLYFVNTRKVLPALSATIDGRAARIAGDIEAAQQLGDEAKHLRDSYESALAEAQANGQKTLLILQDEIKAELEAQSAAFKQKSDTQAHALETRLEQSKADIIDELNILAAGLTVDIAQAVAGITPDNAAAKQAIASLNTSAKAA